MVPYVLGNTMSENGGVTRGICKIENEYLQYVEETHDIVYAPDRTIVGERGALAPDACVSMNIWGFHHALLSDMQAYFDDFLKTLQPQDIKAECLLPVMVNDFLKSDKISVRAKASFDRWFGITYQADRDDVARELMALHAKQVYPEILFDT